MVQMYTIAGRQVGSHVLAMATLGVLFGGTAFAMRGGGQKKESTPPINASSPDEENFIKKFMEEAEAETKKAKH